MFDALGGFDVMLNAQQLQSGLAQFSGTENWYRYMKTNYLYTDGVQWLAENADCYWLLDVVFSWQIEDKVKDEPFQVWKLTVNEDRSALVVCDDGNDNELARQQIEFTDFPLPEIKFYLENSVLCLPRER